MKLKQYLYTQLGTTFFPIFLGLYFITSIIFLVRIASWTSVIQINFLELGLLYLYMLPNILFFTLPITFFVSLIITLSKLSSEYELIVITSFGLRPVDVLKIFAPISFFLSIALLIISLGLIPKAKFLISDFNEKKKKEANFNIKASEFGQKFGDWLIYIAQKDDNKLNDVKLFKTNENVDQFIIADNANLDNVKGNLSFTLFDGKSFHLNQNELNQIDYKVMSINDSLQPDESKSFTTAADYWRQEFADDDNKDKFVFHILASVFPFISLFLVLAYGYFNPRYEKNRAVIFTVISVVGYYVLSYFISKRLLFDTLYVIPLIWIPFTYYLYCRNVKKVY